MARLTQNTLVRKPDTGEVVVLNAGQDVPKWAASQVGSHLTGMSDPEPEVEQPDEGADTEGGDPGPEVEQPKPAARRGRR